MVSISPHKNASNGSSYFDKDSYYAHEDDTSQWYGKAAEDLGLDGAVNKDDFENVLNGISPQGEALSRNAAGEDRRAYIDMTFSAPKSVSLLSYIDPRIEEAHNRAVERTVKEIESNYAHTRLVENGELNTKSTDNLCMARFNHYESRELDPQLHSHVVVMNLTKGDDEKWRSIETGEMFKNQLYIGQYYRNEMAKELKHLGYEIDVTDRNKGLYEVKGIGKEICDEFSTRRKQIEESKKKYEDHNVSEAKKSEYACLDSRRPKTDAKIEEIRADVQERLEKYGQSLESLKEQSLEQGKHKSEELERGQCLSFALEEVTDKQSGFRREEVLSHAMKAGLGSYSAEELKADFQNHSSVQELGSKARFAGKTKSSDTTYYTTEEIRKTEAGIINWAEEGRGKCNIAVSEEKVKEHTESLEEGKKLTKGQQEAVQMICTTNDRLSLVQGDAGSGKSYACDHVRQIMEKEGKTVRGFAPTGKASEELSKAGIECKTVDSFLESSRMGKTGVGKGEVWLVDEAGMMGSRKLDSFLKEAEKHDSKVVLIGDTKQFQSVEQGKIFSDLQKHAGVSKVEMTEVKRQETEHAKEVVQAIKDRDFEKAFSTLEDQGAFKEVESREDRNRQIVDEYMTDRENKVNSAVLTSTNADRNDINKQIRERLEKEGKVDAGRRYGTFQKANLNAVSRNFAGSYKEGQKVVFKSDAGDIKRGTQATIVSTDGAKNSLTLRYFDKESKSYKDTSLDCRKDSAKIQVYDVEGKKFGAGDKIMFQKNDKLVGVKNGQTGTIKSIDDQGNAKIRIGEDKIVARDGKAVDESRYVECNLNNKGDKAYTYLDHAYCITSHKSQGSTYDKCIAAYEVYGHRTNFNEFYVAATRQKQDVTIYTNDKVKFKDQVQQEQQKVSTLDDFKLDFSKHETAMNKNREEVAREAFGKAMPERHPEQRKEQVKEMPKEKEKDRGMDM
jgi:conjugative relaxase-like TrwC/TraI family protein